MGKKRIKSNHLLYNPTAGIRIDFKRFMNAFIKLKTVRYEEFSKLWCEKKMEYLYLGRSTDREAREFIEEIMLIAQEYFLPPYQFQVRVGGLYMLYAIYEIQPTLPKVKIRMTLSQWNDTISFEKQASQQKHLDVLYIIHRLYQEKAFLLCCTPTEHNPYSNAYESFDREEDLADNLKEETTTVTEHFNFDSLEQVSFLLEQYQRAKISFAGPHATKPDKSLDVLSGNFSDDLVGLIQSYKEDVSELLKKASQTSDKQVKETTGNKRKHLKSLAFADKASSSKVNQFIDTELGSKESRVHRESPQKIIAGPQGRINSTEDEEDIIPSKCLRSDNATNDSREEQNSTEQNKAVSNQYQVIVKSEEVEPLQNNTAVQINFQEKAKPEPEKGKKRKYIRRKNNNVISSLLDNYSKPVSISVEYCKPNRSRNSTSDNAIKEPSFKQVAISANEFLVLPPDHVMKNLRDQQFSVMDKQQPKRMKTNPNKQTISPWWGKDRLREKSKSETKCSTSDCADSRAGDKKVWETEIIVHPPKGFINRKEGIFSGSSSATKKAVGAKGNAPNEALLKLKQKCSDDVSKEKSEGQIKLERKFTPNTSLIDDKEVLFEIKKEKLESYKLPLSLTESVLVENNKSSRKKVTRKKKVFKKDNVDANEYKFI